MTKEINHKTSGIYRIWITHENKEYSYIGVSKNIDQRIKTHLIAFKKVANNKPYNDLEGKNFLEITKEGKLPPKYAFYFKLFWFMLQNNLSFEKIKWEIIEKTSWQEIEEVEVKEQEYINHFDSELNGFNGPLAKFFKYQSYLVLGLAIDEKKIKKLLLQEEKRNKIILNKYINGEGMPFLFLVYLPLIPKEKLIILEKQCNFFLNKALLNYENWYQENCMYLLSKKKDVIDRLIKSNYPYNFNDKESLKSLKERYQEWIQVNKKKV